MRHFDLSIAGKGVILLAPVNVYDGEVMHIIRLGFENGWIKPSVAAGEHSASGAEPFIYDIGDADEADVGAVGTGQSRA